MVGGEREKKDKKVAELTKNRFSDLIVHIHSGCEIDIYARRLSFLRGCRLRKRPYAPKSNNPGGCLEVEFSVKE